MTIRYFIDTHALLWYLGGSERLGSHAKETLQKQDADLCIPSIVLAEACWIIQRGRVALTTETLLLAIDKDPRITVIPLDRKIIEVSNHLLLINEMHDRLIVATALSARAQAFEVQLISKDENIIESGLIKTLW